MRKSIFTRVMAIFISLLLLPQISEPLVALGREATGSNTFEVTREFIIQSSRDDCLVSATSVNFTTTGVALHTYAPAGSAQGNYLRFTNVDLPGDAVITGAHLAFTVRDASTRPTTVQIFGEVGSGAALESTVASFSRRTFTESNILMTTPNSITVGMNLSSPDLTSLFNEMRNIHPERTEYVFRLAGNGVGSAIMRSFDSSRTLAPRLVLTYRSASTSFETTIADRFDSAEERVTTGAIDTLTVMEMGGYRAATLTPANRQIVGFRFRNVVLPSNAEIVDAYLEFTTSTAGPAGRVANMNIRTEIGDAPPYTSAAFNISRREYSVLSVDFRQESLRVGQVFRTPNLQLLIDENRLSGWQSGQAMAFMMDGDNFIGAVRQGPGTNPPRLVIRYTYGDGNLTLPGVISNPAEIQNVYINEVSNGSVDSIYPWVEFYNANDKPVLLSSGMFFSDDDNFSKYEFSNFLIPARGFRILYINSRDNDFSANFTLYNFDTPIGFRMELEELDLDGEKESDREFYDYHGEDFDFFHWDEEDFNLWDMAEREHPDLDEPLTWTCPPDTQRSLTTAYDDREESTLTSERIGTFVDSPSDVEISYRADLDKVELEADGPDRNDLLRDDLEKVELETDEPDRESLSRDELDRDGLEIDESDNEELPRDELEDNPLVSQEEERTKEYLEAILATLELINSRYLIINQAYGAGPLDDGGAVSHSFVELFNPTDYYISLAGHSLQLQNGRDAVNLPTQWEKLDFGIEHLVAPHSSFLIRLPLASPSARYFIHHADIDWLDARNLSNRSFSVAIVNHQNFLSQTITLEERAGVIDLLGATNTSTADVVLNFEGAPFGDISRQRAARRINFQDTNNNAADFMTVDYRATGITDAQLVLLRPRWSGDGDWGRPTQIQPADSPLIINQAYGAGPLDDGGAVSHSFVEIFNPTDAPVSLAGHSLQLQNGRDASNPATEWIKLDFDDHHLVGPYGSFLIRLALASPSARYFIHQADVDWITGRNLSNRSFSVALVNHQDLLSMVITPEERVGVIDLLGATNTSNADVVLNYEGAPFRDISRQRAARRMDFQDTDHNARDFISIDYRATGITDAQLVQFRPRWSGDGDWGRPDNGGGTPPPPPGSRTLTLSAFYNNQYHVINQLTYERMAFNETFGRFTDGSEHVIPFGNGGTFRASNSGIAPVVTYTLSVGSGRFVAPVDVEVSTASANTIRYTLDGTIPSRTHGRVYTGPIPITSTSVLRLFIYNDRADSGVRIYAYEIGEGDLDLRPHTIRRTISSGPDDLRATATAVNLTETGLMLHGITGTTPMTTYLRFANIDLPYDAIITNAYLVFTARDASTRPTGFTVSGELGVGAPFTSNIASVNNRNFTHSSVFTQTPDRVTIGQRVNTGDLSGVINEMISYHQDLNHFVFRVDGDRTGTFRAQSFEGNRANAPTLVIEYFSGYGQFRGVSSGARDSARETGPARTVSVTGNIEIGGYRSVTETAVNRQISAFRFPNVTLPPDAEVVDAYIEFTVSAVAPAANRDRVSNMIIRSELGIPVGYEARNSNISNRNYSALSISYQQPAFRTVREVIRTPNLKDIVEENRLHGWQNGQAMAFMLSGDRHIGTVFRSGTADAPRLVIHYVHNGQGPVITGAITDPTLLDNVFINEVSGRGSWASRPTWVELYNANAVPVVLGPGSYLSNRAATLDRFQFNGVVIPPGGFRVMTCDGQPHLGNTHVNFTLSASGSLFLSARGAGGQMRVVDYLHHEPHLFNQSVGRFPDGSSNVVLFQNDSYGISNAYGQLSYLLNVSHDRGVHQTGFMLTLSSPNPNLTIRYTVDGVTTPTATRGRIYNGPIPITRTTTVQVFGFDPYGNTGLQSFTYVLQDNRRNEVRQGVRWQHINTINDEHYAAAMAAFPIVSITLQDGRSLRRDGVHTQGTFEFIDTHVGGENSFFSYAGARRFGDVSIFQPNSGVTVRFGREFGARSARIHFFEPMPENRFQTPVNYTTLQLKEGQDGPQNDVFNLGWLRYSDNVVHHLALQMDKWAPRTRYVQLFVNGRYEGVKTLRENFTDGTFENYFGGDSSDYTRIDFRDGLFPTGRVESGDPAPFNAIRRAVTNRDFQEFKRYVDVEDFIKNHILFMFVDTENEVRAMLHYNAHNGGGVRMISIINDLDGAFFNNGRSTTTGAGYAFAGGGGTYRRKWNSTTSRRGPGGWFGAFSGDSRTNHGAGNLEFRTMVRDQVLIQIGPFGGDMRGACGAPLSVDNVNRLIQKNFDMLNDTHAYRVDAAFMGARPTMHREWEAIHPRILRQTEDRVSFSLQMWAAYGMVHTLQAVAIEDTGSGVVLHNPNPNTHVYFTTDGTDPMGPNGTISTSATRYTPGTVLPSNARLTIRAFTTNNWGPLTTR